ncbi:hypothetical protein HDU76_004219 [Blyttiomyces sp. JEL0837]|nr:hypothetical protein HDU76_004219 [Blyttiomyces sp. JEL0837]
MKRARSPQSSEDDTPSTTSLTPSDDDSDIESDDDVENSKSRNSSTDPSTHLSHSPSALSLAGHKDGRGQANSSENSTVEDSDADDEDVNNSIVSENPHDSDPQTQGPYSPPATTSEPIDQGTQTGEGITKPPLPINRHYKNYKPYRQILERLSRLACPQNNWPGKYTPHLARELFKALCAKSFPADDERCVLPFRLHAVWGLFVQESKTYTTFCDEILGGRFLHYSGAGERLLPLKKKDIDEQAAVVRNFNKLLRARRYYVMLFPERVDQWSGQVRSGTDWPARSEEAALWCWDVDYPINHMPQSMQAISTCVIDEKGNSRISMARFYYHGKSVEIYLKTLTGK